MSNVSERKSEQEVRALLVTHLRGPEDLKKFGLSTRVAYGVWQELREYRKIENPTIRDLVMLISEVEFIHIPNLGRKSLKEVKDFLEPYGLCLGMSEKETENLLQVTSTEAVSTMLAAYSDEKPFELVLSNVTVKLSYDPVSKKGSLKIDF